MITASQIVKTVPNGYVRTLELLWIYGRDDADKLLVQKLVNSNLFIAGFPLYLEIESIRIE